MPGQQEPRVVHELTHGIDILPTMLDVIGVSAPSDLPGTRAGTGGIAIAEAYLAEFGLSSGELRESVNVDSLHRERPSSWAVLEDSWKFMRWSDGREVLYDLEGDAHESIDLSKVRPEIFARLKELMNSLIPATAFEDYLLPVQQDRLDDETLERMRSLGYVR